MCIRISAVNPHEFGTVTKNAVIEIRSRNQRRTSPRNGHIAVITARRADENRGRCVGRPPPAPGACRSEPRRSYEPSCGFALPKFGGSAVGTMREQEGDGPESR
ncbi:LOW QUALITY PROTEIN: hypothetical protein MSG28_001463 [Choristoneura fumiferana]|uniref:Uncharacterized protein n=1 Tax=Choristoneura fumiferana TaxID=7141 RepID=A0ACC0KTZ3_CHOFU|nr:LOW QUALITY PROTEIN: hypothetical protein MSG28_001463 [Choristoneura fumiferana]